MNDKQIQEMALAIQRGERLALSKAITLAESKLEEHHQYAQKIIGLLRKNEHYSRRIAVTGIPGAGKSTFIEALGLQLVESGHKIAVLAIDPSSRLTGGSILGDKTRMEHLSRLENAYIRPSATGGNLGGITQRTYESMILCEAAGYDTIIIETVGVGQSETMVNDITDFFIFLQIAATGDELQGIKRGIMEMTDLIFINKADALPEKLLQESKMDINRALQLLPQKITNWKRPIIKGSAFTSQGISEVIESMNNFFTNPEIIEKVKEKREQQHWLRVETYAQEFLQNRLQHFLQSKNWQQSLGLNSEQNPYEIAKRIIQHFKP